MLHYLYTLLYSYSTYSKLLLHFVDLSHRLIIIAAKSRTIQCGTSMWIALNNIQSTEVGDETIVSVHAIHAPLVPYHTTTGGE